MIDSLCYEYGWDKEGFEIVVDDQDYCVINEYRIGKKYKISHMDCCGKYILENEDEITKYELLGYKFGNYIEVLFDFPDDCSEDFIMDYFSIGKIQVRIDHPSNLFNFVMEDITEDKYYDSENYWTISLKGINNNDYEEYLQKALFLIRYYNKPEVGGWNPSCSKYYGYYDYLCDFDDLADVDTHREQNEDFETMIFDDISNFEAISFYNEAMSLEGKEISFHYFYKVLEFFFLKCRRSEFEQIISDYNGNRNIDCLINSITKMYKEQEENQLLVLLRIIESDITDLIKKAKEEGIIEAETVELFSNALYLYRNKVVHGKSDTRFNVKMPSIVQSKEEQFWNRTIRFIADLLIKEYCFNQS